MWELGIRVRYCIRILIRWAGRNRADMRLDVFDVLVGINLLREGLDIPKSRLWRFWTRIRGFLRSEHLLLQTIGRAAHVMQRSCYHVCECAIDSMKNAIEETEASPQDRDGI